MNILIKKANKTISVDWDAMPAHAQQFIIEYGLRQKLNDSGASATIKELGTDEAGNQAFALAEKTLSALMEGDISVRVGAKALTLEEKAEQNVIRAWFKKICKRALAKEPQQDNQSLLEAMAKTLGKSPDKLKLALAPKIEEEISYLKAKQGDISLDLLNFD